MDDLLDRYYFLKSNQDEVNHLNNTVTPKEIETVIKNLPGPNVFSLEFNKTFKKKKLIAILLKLFHKKETEGTIPNSFTEATVTLKQKPHKDSTKKEFQSNFF